MLKFWILSVFLTCALINCEDVFVNVNNRIWHKVSDKFLSISIDPAVLLAGVNLSEVSLTLAKHLSPAYIRLAGPSTQFVKYIDNEDEVTPYKDEGDDLIITPSMWFGINEWFNLASLTPVFGVNDRETEKGVWDPKSTMPLFEMSDKFGVSCYWQLGYGCSNKTIVQYVEGLNILNQTLSSFPEHNETWKIVGGDLSTCSSDESVNKNLQSYIRDLDETVDAVMTQSSFPSKQELALTNTALWVSISKDIVPVTFQSAMDWAIKVGQAASLDYDVVFREPRLLEITHDTPVYWFSFLHKKLMGSNVLEIKLTNQISNLAVFAHCTKRQNSFVRSGAVTIMAVNNGSDTVSANVRLGSILLEKSMEIQSYCLSASNENTSQILLNDRILAMDMLKRADDILQPRLRRAKIRPHIYIEALPQTITFFILTGAKFPVCVKNEDDLDSILEEMNEDQDVSLSQEEIQFNIEGRHQNYLNRGATGEKITLQNIKKSILKEMELDKSYYHKITKNTKPNNNFVEGNNKELDNEMRETLHKHLRAFIEKSKKNNSHKDSKKENTDYNKRPSSNLHLTIQEIEDILKRRAKTKAAARNIKLTSSELDMLVDKATLKIPKHFVTKRDINRVLLEEKANYYKNNLFTQELFEEMAKERKMFPKFKFRRSVSNSSNVLSRSERDINLDLLKKRTEPAPHFGRGRIVVQPNLKHRKSGFSIKEKQRYAPVDLDAHSDSEEYFDDMMRFEERAFDDFMSPKDSFTELDSLDLDKLEDFFKKTKDKYTSPTTRQRYYYSEKIKSPKTKKKFARVDSDEYLQFLQSSVEEYGEGESCEDELGFSVPPKYRKDMRLRALKPGKTEASKKEPSLCAYFDELSFSNDMDYYFSRKKRESGTIPKEKLRSMKKDMMDQIKKLKHQLKDDKAKYLQEKLKNKLELKKQKYSDKLLLSRKHRTSIQVIPKHEPEKTTENVNINDIIAKANSEENTIPSSLDHKITKRSLSSNNINELFGQYKPRTSELKAWKPADILSLNNNNYMPVYSWVQDNMKNAVVKKYLLRRRRFIEDNSINYDKNELYDSKHLKKIGEAKAKDYRLSAEEHNVAEEVDNRQKNEYKAIEIGKHFVNREDEHPLFKVDEHSKNSRNKYTESPDLREDQVASDEQAGDKEIYEERVISNEIHKKKDYNVTNIDKTIISPKKSHYLERILGTEKVKPIEDFVQTVKSTFDKLSKDIRGFFKNLF